VSGGGAGGVVLLVWRVVSQWAGGGGVGRGASAHCRF